MTNEQFRQKLSKYHLNLVCVPWGDTKHTFNLDKSVKQALDINSFPKEHSGGIIDESSKNNFVGMFAPKFLYLITAYPDNKYLPKDANKVMHMIHTDGVNQYVVAQIDATHRNLWQRDNHYRPTDHKLWKLVKSFVYTPIVQRDKDEYILVSYKHNSKSKMMRGYNLLSIQYDDTNDQVSYDNYYCETNTTHEGGNDFVCHFPLSFIKNYLKKHPIKYYRIDPKINPDCDTFVPIKKIVPVKDDIPYVRHALEKHNRTIKDKPRMEWDFINIFNHCFKGHKHHLLIKMKLAGKAFSHMSEEPLYKCILDALNFREWGVHKMKDNALKIVYNKLKTNPDVLFLNARQVYWLSQAIYDFDEDYGYSNDDDKIWEAQVLDGVRCSLDEFYCDQKGE